MTQVEMREEVSQGERPTTLTLFRFTPEQLERARQRQNAAVRFRQDFTQVIATDKHFIGVVEERKQYVGDTIDAVKAVISDYKSSDAVGTMFLTVDENLELLGAPPKERFDFFTRMLELNLRADEPFAHYVMASNKQHNNRQNVSAFEGPLAKKRGIDRIFAQMTATVPSWYKGNKEEWRFFVARYSLYSQESTGRNRKGKEFGIIKRTTLPNWYTTSNGQLPTREAVELEMASDLLQWKQFSSALNNAVDCFNNGLSEYEHNMFTAAAASVEQQRRNTFPGLTTLSDVLQLIQMVSDDVYEYTVARPEDMLPMSNQQLIAYRRTPAQIREKAIGDFTARQEITPSLEVVALFLERKLIDGEMMQDTTQPIADNHIGAFGFLIDAMDEAMPLGDQFFALLKETYPKLYTALNEHIRPLLTFVPQEERSEIKELITGAKGSTIEDVIFLLAGTITKYARSEKKTLAPLRVFMEGWLQHFAENQELNASLTNAIGKQTENTGEDTLIQTQIRNLKEATQKVSQGNLSGWHIYFAAQPNDAKEEYQEITGETIAERQALLGQHIQAAGIPLEPRPIIDALDWLVTLPKEVSEANTQKEEPFSRVKPGQARVSYAIEPLKKEVVITVEP